MSCSSRCLAVIFSIVICLACTPPARAQRPEDVIGGIVEDLLKGRSPIRRPPPPPTIGTLGSLRVVNESSMNARVEVKFSNGRDARRTVRPGQTDTWQGLPGGAQGSVTLGQNFRSFRVPGNGLLTMTVTHDGRIFPGTPPVDPPGGGPPKGDPPRGNPPPRRSPADASAAGSNSGEIGTNPPAPRRLTTSAPVNPLPRFSAERLSPAATKELSQASNRELRAILENLKQAAATRLSTLGSEMNGLGFHPQATDVLIAATASGNIADLPQLLRERIPDTLSPEASAECQTKLTALTSFHDQFNILLSKFDAGADFATMAAHVSALRQQGTNLDVDELAGAMTALQQHLMIRDAINQAAQATVLGSSGPAIPKGPVNVIRHPRIHAGTTFIGAGQTVLVGVNGPEIEVMRTSFSNAMGMPMASTPPFPDWDEPRLIRGVLIHNPAEHQVELSYRLNEQPHRLQAGTEQFLDAGRNWIIEFSRGPNRPNARYNISKEGTYAFAPEQEGWNLRRRKFELTLINPPNGLAFNYLVDGEPFQLERGEHRKHESSHPIVVQFDRGNGTGTAAKLVTDKLPLYIALDPSTMNWDLYGEPLDVGTGESAKMTLALPKIEDFITNPRSILFEFEQAKPPAPPANANLFEALQSAQ